MLQEKGADLHAGFAVKESPNTIQKDNILVKTAIMLEKNSKISESGKDRLSDIIDVVKSKKEHEPETSSTLLNKFGKIVYNGGISRINTLGKFWTDGKCNLCLNCQKICPSGNIEIINEKPHWNQNCEFCQACVQWCPKGAVHIKNEDLDRRYHHPEIKIKDLILRRRHILKIPDQEKYWDNVAEEKEFPTPFQLEEFGKYVSKHMKLLDVGCGYGRTLNELYNHGFHNLTGIDYSQGMINRGKRLYPHLNLIKNDGNTIPFSDNEFDAVILLAVLTSSHKDEEQENLISEISRVLKNKGILYINDYLINQDERNLKRYNKYRDKYGTYGVFELSEWAIFRHHTKEHIKKLTQDFLEIIFEETVYDTMNGHKSNGFYYIGRIRK